MPPTTENLRIRRTRPLLAPAILAEELPVSSAASQTVQDARGTIEAMFEGRDRRPLVIVGPCSIHDPDAALDYAENLQKLRAELGERLEIVMRVYFEKPRSVVGWKGLINDPGIDQSFQINRGLRTARGLLCQLADRGMPAATEFLDTTLGQFYADLISWGAIGARTTESQIHRELASGLSMPVGFKNRTDGDVSVAVDAIRAAAHPHLFPSLTKEGAPAILETHGNPYCHLVLRGGNRTGPNYAARYIADAEVALEKHALPKRIMVDASHGNSGKDPAKQPAVLADVAEQIQRGNQSIFAVMIESHLVGGRQDSPVQYGQSITDACLSFSDTEKAIREFADAIA